MTKITARDGTRIFYKDWGPKDAQPIVFHHGWPLSADDWDNQMMYFLAEGYRVIAHDRRGHGRSSQTDTGNDMDTYAADVAELVAALDLRNAIHIGHSTGGGEVTRYVARAAPGRVAKAVLIDAVPPLLVKTDASPLGTPLEVFDGMRAALAANRAQFYLDFASGPFYGFNRPGAKVSEGLIQNWAAGNDGQHPGPPGMHQGLLRDRLQGRPEGDRRAGAGDPQRGRPDRALCECWAADRQASEERQAHNLQRAAARPVPDQSRDRESRDPGLRSRRGGAGGAAGGDGCARHGVNDKVRAWPWRRARINHGRAQCRRGA